MARPPTEQSSALPAEVTSFIGRRHDIAAVRQLFGSTRLVTLTGIGGIGKTRLALSVAHDSRRAFKDGVHFVQLASLTDPELIPQALVDALNIREQPKSDALDVLCDNLRDAHALLILDNCEHLVEAAAHVVDRILRSAPSVRILATSRQALRNDGEHLYPVSPLLTPSPRTVGDGTAANYPAVKLFADRAAAIVPDFRISEANQEVVAQLCRRLEGIPLALELAAVRLQVLTLTELVDRLEDRFQVLGEGSRSLPLRHQTLRAVIDWSHDLCSPKEQLAWARASIFAGSFSYTALETVCSDPELPSAELLNIATALVEKSILIREEHSGQIRFRMLDTIREYGRARLRESGEHAVLARRHRDWIATMVEVATREWAGPGQVELAERLQLDHPNIRLALEYCMADAAEVEVGISIAAQPWFWACMDHLNEAQMWLDRGLAQLDEPSHELAWGLATRGYIAAWQGDAKLLAELPLRARAMAVELEDLPAVALANHVVGFRQALLPGEIRKAIPLFIEAMAQYSEAGMARQYRDVVVVELATTHILLHEFDRARALADGLRVECEAIGERWNLSFALWLLALISLLGDDDPARAEEMLLQALRIKRLFRDTLGLGLTLEVLGWTAAASDQTQRAAVLMGGADRIWDSLGAQQLQEKRSQFQRMALRQLGATAFETARAKGRAMSVDESVQFALKEAEDITKQERPESRLTRREQQVAELVAEGLSNQQIAARLVISVRTAEGHVEKILAKQGFKARAQIAAWITEHRSPTEHGPFSA